VDVVVKGNGAGVKFSNGEVVPLSDAGTWLIHKLGTVGRGFSE
jgi:hypothetical protein